MLVLGSIFTSVRSSPAATTHTKPSPLATDPSSMISRPSGIAMRASTFPVAGSRRSTFPGVLHTATHSAS